MDCTKHRLYTEFQGLLRDDAIFADMYEATEADFLAWAFSYEIDSDWEDTACRQ